jgi:hypothetical protein
MVVTHAPVPVGRNIYDPVLMDNSGEGGLYRQQAQPYLNLGRLLYDPPDLNESIYNARGQNGLGQLTGLIIDYYT